MTNTRDQILKTLLMRQRCTINELAEVVGINPISVRHHIIKLQASRLVDSEEERHGVGRPRRLYFLTDNAVEQFPTRYLQLTNRLLEKIKAILPKSALDDIFSQLGEDMAEDYKIADDLKSLPMEKRLEILNSILSEEGYNFDWELKGDEYHIKELNCPYYHIGQNHPEVCEIDHTLISNVLAVPTNKVQCILDGDSYCKYIVPNITVSEILVQENQAG